MVIKSKRYNPLLKILVFILTIALTCLLVFLLTKVVPSLNQITFTDLDKKKYTDSSTFKQHRFEIEFHMSTILKFKKEENITKDSPGIKEEIEVNKNNAFWMKRQAIYSKLEQSGIPPEEITEQKALDIFETDYKEEIEQITTETINQKVMEFKEAIQFFQKNPSLIYYFDLDGEVLSNTTLRINEIESNYHYAFKDNTHSTQAIYAFKNDYVQKKNSEFSQQIDDARKGLIAITIVILVILACMIFLILTTGRKAFDSKVYHPVTDRLYNEFTLALLVLSAIAAGFCSSVIYEKYFNRNFMFTLLAISVAVFLFTLLILVRHIKSRTLLKHTLIYKILSTIYGGLVKIFHLGSPITKLILIIVGLGLLTMIPFVGLITIPLAVWFAYHQAKKFLLIKKGLEAIKNGTYSEKISLEGEGEFEKIAADINEISSGLGLEVERRLKSERLKTELIVNVSHDIRTPLTSLITYTDLLQKEPTDNENSKKYVDVIAKKAERLKVLIDDLFEASKAASGNITVNLEKVDMHALITQGLGELDDRIKSSTLDFRVNLPEEKIYAWADGRLLWRVIENLLSNVFKYSLNHSRVYIQLFEDEKQAFVEIKNISAYELNIPEDEIMERFKRGDASRNSEGSGLGLDIAKSLMACQYGSLEVKVDGDLFKVTVCIKKCIDTKI